MANSLCLPVLLPSNTPEYNPHQQQSQILARKLERTDSTTEFTPLGDQPEVEYFFASDASAVIEHTNRVIFLEDDDFASVDNGSK